MKNKQSKEIFNKGTLGELNPLGDRYNLDELSPEEFKSNSIYVAKGHALRDDLRQLLLKIKESFKNRDDRDEFITFINNNNVLFDTVVDCHSDYYIYVEFIEKKHRLICDKSIIKNNTMTKALIVFVTVCIVAAIIAI